MRRRPIILGALLVIVAFAIQANYDNQLKTLIFGQSVPSPRQLPALPEDFSRRLVVQGFSTDTYIRLSSYLIGALGIMSIIVGSSISAKSSGEAP